MKQSAQSKEGLWLEMTTDADDGRPVYLAGNFNEWKAGDERYRMEKVGSGKYRIYLAANENWPVPLEYKYLRGTWEGEELDPYGNMVPNRKVAETTGWVKDFVPRWEQHLTYREELLPVIEVISDQFSIPQLIKTRRIAVLLPHDYHQHPDKRYPVLYLQDGQNLFEDFAPFGTWGVNKRLAALAEKGLHEIIVVAIDHAEEDRVREYTPSFNTRLGIGQGKKYVRFLADTLKPYIDRQYRTLPDREHTGIGGSSMGGLITIYAGMMYPEVYSKLMVFSPSLWVTPNIRFQFINMFHPEPMRIYLYVGGQEGENTIANVERFKEALEQQGRTSGIMQFQLSIDPAGKHNEARWGHEFSPALRWLFFEKNEV